MKTALLIALLAASGFCGEQSYVIVGTGQTNCYDDRREIAPPKPGQPFHGQDAQHPGPAPSYRDNGDGTITDLNTGLMWVQARGSKLTWDAAVAGAKSSRVGGHADWRMPTIKELYSLINFNGRCDMPAGASGSTPYLDTKYFEFKYGDESQGERVIDCQDWTATEYVSTTMNGNPTVFGVNFADGRIKGYPKVRHAEPHKLYVRYARGNPQYGKNDFRDNGDDTITDCATGLMWQKADSGIGMNWEAALAWVQQKNAAHHLGHNDWRLPNAKELQSLVDYTRAPAATQSPAIAPLFQVTKLSDGDFPFFWTSTTHLDGPPDRQGGAAIYIAFGRATGWMQPRGGGGPPGARGPGPEGPGLGGPRFSEPGQGGQPDVGQPSSGGSGTYQLLDVHGAGAQRSDPKAGDPAMFPHGRGPQGDVIRINNFVRCVRGGLTKP